MMADNASRRGAVDLGVPLMILAFLVIGYFLYWLNVEATAQRAMGVMEDTTAASTDLDAASTIAATELEIDPTPLEGRVVRVAGLEVASRLGAQGFWLSLPNQNPFLVSMAEQVVAEGTSVASGQTVTVTGTLLAMNDSIVSSWSAAGTINEGDRLAAEFATHFIQAARVEITEGLEGDPGSEAGSGN